MRTARRYTRALGQAAALALLLSLAGGSALASTDSEVDEVVAFGDAQATTTQANIANNALLVNAQGQSCRLELPPLVSLNEVRVSPFGMQGSDHTNGQSAQQPPQAGTSVIERCVLQEVYEFDDPVAGMDRRAKLELLEPKIDGFEPVYSPVAMKGRTFKFDL